MYAQRGGDVVPGLVGEEVESYDGGFHVDGNLTRHGASRESIRFVAREACVLVHTTC